MKHNLNGYIKTLSVDIPTGKTVIAFSVDEHQAKDLYDDLYAEKSLSITVDKHRDRRSRNANNYAWKLITDIGDALRQSKEEIYLEMLRRYGQSEMISVVTGIDISPYLKYYDRAGESTLRGKSFTHYKVYKGSSEYDTREMSVFIDGIVSDAKEIGIPTETPEEIARLKSLWGES